MADWERLPEGSRADLIDGTLFLAPGPGTSHQRVATVLAAQLVSRFDETAEGPGTWLILATPTLELSPGRIVIPDLAGWRAERVTEGLPAGPRIGLAPDWIAEIRSPSTASVDTLTKGPVYRQAGVGWYWIIDPDAGLVEVFRGEGPDWLLEGGGNAGDRDARLPPFDGGLDVQRWFSGLR